MASKTENIKIYFIPDTSKGTYKFNIEGSSTSNFSVSGGTIYVKQPTENTTLHSFTPKVDINYIPVTTTYSYKLNYIQFPILSDGGYPTSTTTVYFDPYTTS